MAQIQNEPPATIVTDGVLFLSAVPTGTLDVNGNMIYVTRNVAASQVKGYVGGGGTLVAFNGGTITAPLGIVAQTGVVSDVGASIVSLNAQETALSTVVTGHTGSIAALQTTLAATTAIANAASAAAAGGLTTATLNASSQLALGLANGTTLTVTLPSGGGSSGLAANVLSFENGQPWTVENGTTLTVN